MSADVATVSVGQWEVEEETRRKSLLTFGRIIKQKLIEGRVAKREVAKVSGLPKQDAETLISREFCDVCGYFPFGNGMIRDGNDYTIYVIDDRKVGGSI